jgi:hypothetical protein
MTPITVRQDPPVRRTVAVPVPAPLCQAPAAGPECSHSRTARSARTPPSCAGEPR